MEKKPLKPETRSEKRDQYTVVLEDIRSNFRAFGDNLGFIRSDVGEIKQTLGEHGRILGDHTRILGEHTRILGDHTRILGEHGRKLDSHTKMIGQLMVDVQEIKTELKAKVDRDEFARLEKRVIALERCGVEHIKT